MRRSLVIPAILLLSSMLNAQDTAVTRGDSSANFIYLLRTATFDGQTYPMVELKEVFVYGTRSGNVKFNYRRHARLVYNVRRVYPYSVMVREELGRVNRLLETLPNEKEKRNFLQQYEKDIFNAYEEDMKKLTFTQGKILIKLIDRETQNTSYDLIREYRGKFSALFWQSIARIFGTNLKSDYDPGGDDYLIEVIVRDIEAGKL